MKKENSKLVILQLKYEGDLVTPCCAVGENKAAMVAVFCSNVINLEPIPRDQTARFVAWQHREIVR